jgi:hypothetical protein
MDIQFNKKHFHSKIIKPCFRQGFSWQAEVTLLAPDDYELTKYFYGQTVEEVETAVVNFLNKLDEEKKLCPSY